MASDADLELAFYDKFLLSRGLEPYPVQEQAVSAIFAGQSVLVTVPTGTGKTLMAKAALFRAVGKGERAIYTTPLRALTEEKYRELCADLRDFYYAVMSQRTNEVMKVLTIVATLFMPLSFIAGVYGMNFDTSYPLNMPELHWRYGYIFSLVLMALTAGGLIWFFARRGWLTLDEVVHDPKDIEP